MNFGAPPVEVAVMGRTLPQPWIRDEGAGRTRQIESLRGRGKPDARLSAIR
jgi:hypothetical protein